MVNLISPEEILSSFSTRFQSMELTEQQFITACAKAYKEVLELPDKKVPLRQKYMFYSFFLSAFFASDSFSMDNRLDALVLFAASLDTDGQNEEAHMDYRPFLESIFQAWYKCNSGSNSSINAEVQKLFHKNGNSPTNTQIMLYIMGAIKNFLLQDEALDLANIYSDSDMEGFVSDIHFNKLGHPYEEDHVMMRKFRALHETFSFKDGRIVFDNPVHLANILLYSSKRADLLKAFYNLRGVIEKIQKRMNCGLKEWGCKVEEEIKKQDLTNEVKRYKTFDDLPRELQVAVLDKEKFNRFVVALNEELVYALEGKTKSIWDVVLFVCNHIGIFDGIKRRSFAKIISIVVEDWVESETTLYSSMTKCNDTTGKDYSKYETYPSSTSIRKLGDPILKIIMDYM